MLLEQPKVNTLSENSIMKIYLASKSPRRRELLEQIQVDYECLSSEIDESVTAGELPLDYVQRMATSKAVAGWASKDRVLKMPLLAADTSVVVDQNILGKPEDREQAYIMLKLLAGRTHKVMTSVAMTNGENLQLNTSVTKVTFSDLTEQMVEQYIDTGDCFDKAGGYGIQGFAAQFVTSISGSYSGVVGLPLYETSILLGKFSEE